MNPLPPRPCDPTIADLEPIAAHLKAQADAAWRRGDTRQATAWVDLAAQVLKRLAALRQPTEDQVRQVVTRELTATTPRRFHDLIDACLRDLGVAPPECTILNALIHIGARHQGNAWMLAQARAA